MTEQLPNNIIFDVEELRKAKLDHPDWVFLIGDSEKSPEKLTGKWKKQTIQTPLELEDLIDKCRGKQIEAWNYGPKTGLNNLATIDFDWEWVYYAWVKKFGERAVTLTFQTPNKGYRVLYYTLEKNVGSPFKKSLHTEFLANTYVAVGGYAVDVEGTKQAYTKTIEAEIKKDNSILQDTKNFLVELQQRCDFLGYKCVNEQIGKQKHIKLDHDQRKALLHFMLTKNFQDEEVHDFYKTIYETKGTQDYERDKTQAQIESGQEYIRGGGLPHPCKPKVNPKTGNPSIPLYQIFPFDSTNCQGCRRKSDYSTQKDIQVTSGEKQGEKGKKELKDSGRVDNGCFEAIYYDGQPFFLMKNSEEFSIVESVELNGEKVYPKDVKHIPYEPYGYFKGSIPNHEDLFWMVRNEFQSFIEVESVWKDVLAICVLLSYQQEKLQTLPYIYLYGDNESGKSTVLQVLKFLCYRPMYGVTIPSADLYGYLEDSDSIGVILEDEVQGIDDDTDKIKIYKAGYKQGAVVPRMIMTEHDRIIKYYQTFCFKVCASEQIPHVKGFRERFVEIPMVEGYPAKEWADVTKEDLERLRKLRNTLLKWRMTTRTLELPNVEVPVKGRVKELWKPLLQVAHGLAVYDTLFKVVEDQRKERLSAKQDTLEGHIVKVVTEILDEAEEPIKPIPFSTIWNALVLDLNGKVDDKKPNIMDTSEFFDVSKNKVGYRLREVLSGKTKVLKEKVGDGWVSFKAYEFNLEKLWRVNKKYGYEFSTKLLSVPSSEGVPAPETAQKTEKPDKNNVENAEKKVENAEKKAENTAKKARTPQELGKLGNLVEKPTYLYKHVKTAEPCELCGQLAVEWEITAPDGSVIRRCNACFVKMRLKFAFKEESNP